ncbi:MAG: transposase [Oscillospiraceae bacterium]|nr:transposase [Oscillospiraceae bacterium]
MTNRRDYTLEERTEIVKEHLETEKSIGELAAEHNLGYHLVYDWVKKCKAKGVSGLEDWRGQRRVTQEPQTPEEKLRVRIAQLERENYLLKMERDLLKK